MVISFWWSGRMLALSFLTLMVYNERFHRGTDHSREARSLNYNSNPFLHVPGRNELSISFPIVSTRKLNIRLHAKPSVKQRTSVGVGSNL